MYYREPARIYEIIDVLRKYWVENPDMRLGQIIVNAAREYGMSSCSHDIFELEDYEMLDAIMLLSSTQSGQVTPTTPEVESKPPTPLERVVVGGSKRPCVWAVAPVCCHKECFNDAVAAAGGYLNHCARHLD